MARVLVADDDATVRTVLAAALRTEGLEVDVARDGAAAIASALVDPPDVIVLDLSMPSIDGWIVATRLLAEPRTAHVPIVFLAERTSDVDLQRGRMLGGVAYVSKPFDIADLCQLVHDLVERVAGDDDIAVTA
jgi:CheY-like chemotaxis protein